MADQMLSFNDVVNELGISEEELKKLVADNEIRSFHEGGELTFKQEDVNQLKNRLETAPTIVLSDTDSSSLLEEEPVLDEPGFDEALLEEEPVLDQEAELELPEMDEISPSEETVLDVDGILEDSDSITLDDPDTVAADEQSLGDDTVLDAGLGDEEDLSFGLDDTEEEDILGQEVQSGPRRITARTQEANPVMTGLLVFLAILLALPGAILVNLSSPDGGVFPDWISKNLTFMNDLIDSILGLF